MDLADQPPDGFDVAGLKSNVRAFQIHPVGDAACQLVPFFLVARDAVSTGLVECGDAETFNLLAPVKTQFLFDFDFNREAVRVPACFAFNLEPFEGLIAAKNVFDGTTQNMVYAWSSVSRWRPFVEREAFPPFTDLHAALKGSLRVPKMKHLILESREIE